MTETLYAHVWETLSREKIMHQTTLGLDYLHGLKGGFIHRNIHGRNVLVAEIESSSGKHYVVKLSDFRFGKSIVNDGNLQSNTRSPTGWTAPEIVNRGNVGPRTDVFILGCFFYYVLSGGEHPFGDNIGNPNRESNILNNKPDWTQHTPKAEAAKDNNFKNLRKETQEKLKAIIETYLELMKRMTSANTSDRPTTGQILRHFDTKEYFPIYSDNTTAIAASTDGSKSVAATRPGLCLIFHQDQFPNVNTSLFIHTK